MSSKKIKTMFVCSNCGFDSPKWSGICPSCGEGNSMVEFNDQKSRFNKKSIKAPLKIKDIEFDENIRMSTGISELDRVLGGGIVKGSFVLLSGSPGVGKSTILLQISENYENILYVSGEESSTQLKIRNSRLHLKNENLLILSETNIDNICEAIRNNKLDLVIIDSIQTIYNPSVNSISGSVSQVRECATMLLNLSKESNVSILAVSHVNKEGAIAGPKVLEHMVDVVLYFEAENRNSYRVIRCIKNRFGSTNEIGVFQMKSSGLEEVKNPSLVMLEGRSHNSSGSCIASVVEGSRAFLVEIQALVTPSNLSMPRRVSNGYDYNRLCMILAVLEKKAGFYFYKSDVYVNVVGGVRIYDPSADLPIAISLISSLKDKVLDKDLVSFGEIGLSGEIRQTYHPQIRIDEAKRLGLKNFIVPYLGLNSENNLNQIRNVREIIKTI